MNINRATSLDSRVQKPRRNTDKERGQPEAKGSEDTSAQLSFSAQALELAEKHLDMTGLLVGGALGATAGSALGLNGSIVGGAIGATLGFGVGHTYTVPDELYHFTSENNALKIMAQGCLEARPGNHGVGIYSTRYSQPLLATLQRAASTEIRLDIPTKGLTVKRTFVPGTFKITQNVDTRVLSATPVETDRFSKFLQSVNFRDVVNPNQD